jgi:hypothetical protein
MRSSQDLKESVKDHCHTLHGSLFWFLLMHQPVRLVIIGLNICVLSVELGGETSKVQIDIF